MEKFDVYDDDRLPLNKSLVRGQDKCGENENRMVVHICVFNSKNEMLIQQRQPHKHPYPNLWDVSAGGSCMTGETSKEGARRELMEELGIDYDFSNQRAHLTVNFEHGFNDFYLIECNVDADDVHMQEEEVQGVKWASEQEILARIDNGTFIPYHKALISTLFAMKDNRGCQPRNS